MKLRFNVIYGGIKSNIVLSTFLVILLSFGLIGGCSKSGGNSGQSGINIRFTNVTVQAGLDYVHGFLFGGPATEAQLISGGVAAGDYDNDGWVDLYVVRGTTGANLLFRNLGNGSFQEVGQSAGLALSGTIGSGPTFADFSGDGFLDLFIGGVSPTGVSFFLNNGDGTFSNITGAVLETAVLSNNTFSAAFGDYDMDGDLDLFMTHWGSGIVNGTSQHLWRNNGDTTFTDVSIASGIASTYQGEPDWTFSPNFADINNDGYPDILLAGDFVTSQVFINQKNGTFVNTTDSNVITDENGMGAGVGDYDNDGDIDIFITNNNQSPKLFRNDGGNTNNFLSIKLNGLSPNREGVGSRVTITVNNQNQIRELRVGSNFVSQNPVRAHFGLGNAELVNLVQVDWADGETTVLQNVSSNQFLEIDHPNL